MEKELFNFEKLMIYQKSLDHLDFAYRQIDKFPYIEKNNLSDQYRRAALSICLNLAEGSGGTNKEFKNFIRISRRSIKECLVCSTVALRRKYILENDDNEARLRLTEMSRMCSGLYNSIK
jgi:four helix bundle protein